MNKDLLKLYAITDRSWLHGRKLIDDVRKVLEGGVTLLQLREKTLPEDDFLAEAREIKALCDEYHVPLLINDDVKIARELGLGAHVGQEDMSLQEARALLGPDVIIGVSCQTVAQAIEAERAGADYLGVGAVFPTATKGDAIYVGERELAAICAAVHIPIVAIGGISRDNLQQLGGSGIAGIAVVSALFAANDIQAATRQLLADVETMLAVPVPHVKGAIIDLDGTILDSLPYWETLGADYLASKGKTARPGLRQLLDSMEIEAGATYLKETYGLVEDVPTIVGEILGRIRHVYAEVAPLYPGAAELLHKLHRQGTRLALFTASERDAAIASLRKNHVYDLFDCIISTLDTKIEKSSPVAYYQVLGRLGTALDSTTIYEDAPYAIEGAKQTGMRVVTLEHK